MLLQQVKKQLQKVVQLQEEKFLIAVSTGVDSMVLLDLFQRLKEEDVAFGVAHVNHQLRDASEKEAAFLQDYCQKKNIPFYMKRWENSPVNGVEAAARSFRYRFFAEIMAKEGYTVLLTAHHSDDLAETMLMKIIRDGNLKNAAGINYVQPFSEGQLIRPLLAIEKTQISAYAKQRKIPFFEDETNQTSIFQRNRIRQQVLPVIKNENPQVLTHFQQFSQQLSYANEWLAKQQEEKFSVRVAFDSKIKSYTVDLLGMSYFSEAELFFFADYLLQKVSRKQQVTINSHQQTKLFEMLQLNIGQWQMDLSRNWQISRIYHELKIQRKQSNSAENCSTDKKMAEPLILTVGKGIFLSENQWVGLFLPEQQVIPDKMNSWSEFSKEILLPKNPRLLIRKRRSGDRIQLTKTLSKKLRRFFIDEKIPNQQRAESWVVTTQQDEILAVLPHLFSYLSIGKETDKIHYVLLYKYQK